MNFLELNVKPEICSALAKIGITDAFQIQELTTIWGDQFDLYIPTQIL